MYYYAISSDVIGTPNLHSSPRYFLGAMILVLLMQNEHTHVFDELLSIRFGSNGVNLGWHNPRALSHDHCLLFVLSAVLSLCF